MASPGYNCMFSAVAGASDAVMTCTEVRAANTNAGCPMYNSEQEECNFAGWFASRVRAEWKDPDTA